MQVKNLIYQEVFNLNWVEKNLICLRPYSQNFDAWLVAKQQDKSRLLRGEALIYAQNWARGKSLSDLDYKFLAQSEELDRIEVQQALEAARLTEVEARLLEQKKNARRQNYFIATLSMALILALGWERLPSRNIRNLFKANAMKKSVKFKASRGIPKPSLL